MASEIRIPNSNSLCLIENWNEERLTKCIDGETESAREVKCKRGHPELLSQHFGGYKDSVTHTDYKNAPSCAMSETGIKGSFLGTQMQKKIYDEVYAEFNPTAPPTDFRSVTQIDYFHQEAPKLTKKDEQTKEHVPTRPCDYVREQPITFWTEHRDRLHGHSQVKTFDTPFRKNAAFSTPIDEYWNSPKPNELENYPKM